MKQATVLTSRDARVSIAFIIALWAFNGSAAQDGATVRMPEESVPAGLSTSGTQIVPVAERYDAGSLREAILGAGYRDVWSTSVHVSVLDLDRTAGGLTPIARANEISSQLILESEDGRRYVLRTLQKDAGEALPEGYRRTFVEDLAQDHASSLNPYGALIVAPLARAAGILHMKPVLVVVPDSPRLGSFRDAFAGKLALFEPARPDMDEDVIDTPELVQRLEAEAAARVDQRAFVRARLFDMWIGDRSRHEGRWLWAALDGGTRFVPIPIGRDYAFARAGGWLGRIGRLIGSSLLGKPTYFGDEIGSVVRLNYEAAALDYRFTSELDRSNWIAIAVELQSALSDAAIEESVRQWPAPIFDEIGAETIETLKRRRDGLAAAAETYFKKLMQTVDIVGSDEAERFEINQIDGAVTDVRIYASGEKVYERRIVPSDTDELRLFGLGGDDEFVITGDSDVTIFVVGGDGDDSIRNDGNEQVHFYDTQEEPPSSAVKTRRLSDPADDQYHVHGFEFDRGSAAFAFDYDSDEGIYIGGGLTLRRFAFMREPYASRHVLRFNIAPTSQAYNITYDARIYRIFRSWDANFQADILEEDLFNDFYGLGNETSGSDENRRQFIARFRWITAFPAFSHKLGPRVEMAVGPYFEYADIEPPPGVSEANPISGFTAQQFVDTYFAGVRSRIEADARDSAALTESGFRWIAEAAVYKGVRHSNKRFAKLASELSYFYTLPVPGSVTAALRTGAATNLGDFNFYQANTLGGRENLRGFRKTRFSGRSSAFANAELRVKLGDFNVYLTRGELGVFGFYDVGRVWMEGERSRIWHQGYGAGAWITPFNEFVISSSLGFSEEGKLFSLSLGMFF